MSIRNIPRRRAFTVPVGRIIVYLLAIIFAVLWFVPIWATITTASKDTPDFFSNPFWSLPHRFNLIENMITAWNNASLGQGFMNSLIYGVVGAAIAVLIAAIASYGLVVLKIKGAFLWFLVIFSGTLFPYQIYIVPLYQMYSNLGLYDSQIGMLIFYVAVCIPFCTLVLRSFFSTVPDEIAQAARVDGSSEFRIFCQLYLPLSVSALLVLFLFQFTWIWNDLLFGLVLSNSPEVRPVMASLSSLMGVYAGTSFTIILAGALVASLPTLVIFLGLQRYFMEGLTLVARPR
ncbi:permease [Reticulibacter mediterranei]|uniref:Permease n=1 Tax=Reticulibacter mediterranei TaxID=2778369 RepID=A0A8J3IKY5_9CHLR|nr:carbohydrate ABC transporter permease [Reticulibacter mediterranei]GHO96416.1 permease [Reticulibacter mediterranei]